MTVIGTMICQSCGKEQSVFLDSDDNPVRWSDVKQDYVPVSTCIECRRLDRSIGINTKALAISMLQYLRLHNGEITPSGVFAYWKRQGHVLYDNGHDNMKLINVVSREVSKMMKEEQDEI